MRPGAATLVTLSLVAASAAAQAPAPADARAVLLQQARYWNAQYQPDRARISLQRLLRLDPANADALAELARLETGQGHAVATEADPGLRLMLADAQARQGRLAEAEQTLREAIARRPGDSVAMMRLAALLQSEGRATDGAELQTQAMAADLAQADLARARGDRGTALELLRRARALRTRQLDAQEQTPAQPGLAPATSLALLDPPELQAPTQAATADPNAAETDEDGDRVIVRQRMLDTAATDLPPPLSYPPSPFRAAAPALAETAPEPPMPKPAPVPVPVVMAASQDGGAADPAPADPAVPPLAELAPAATPADPMTARIDRDIVALTDEAAPSAQGAVGFRGRSGSPGTSQLAEITVPLDASYALGDGGRLKLSVTPTFLTSGSVPQGVGNQAQFGSLALGLRPSLPGIGGQSADGAGLDLAYLNGSFSADIGSTPLGFQQQNVVGGLEWAPSLADGVRLRMTGERRAVTDSLLSFAGTQDPQSGQRWGGVTYARGHANLEFSAGPADLYVGGGGGVLDGQDVKSNTEVEAGAGGSLPLWKTPAQELRLGLDLVYFDFARNLGGFTLGQGGYFSPQSYFAALLPVTFKGHPTEDLSYEIGATAGIQTYRQDSSPTFPNNADLQSALEAQQANPATAVPGAPTSLGSKNQTGFSGGAHAALDYRVTPAFHVGAKADYEHTGNFNQTVGLLYGRYIFDGSGR